MAHDTARRLLGQMPVDEHSSRPARVVSLELPPALANAVSIEADPLDAWWRVEDLLLRLVMHRPVTVYSPPAARVVMHGLWRCTDGALGQLRRAALDPDTYQCWHDGRWLAFSCLSASGLDLSLAATAARRAPSTTSRTSLVSWPGGNSRPS